MAAGTRIIIKKKANHGGHHGGAWKVAYADFVTALMALFIVLWLVNSSKAVQNAVGGYFRDPKGTAHLQGQLHAKPIPGSKEDISQVKPKEDLVHLKDDLQKTISRIPTFAQLSKQVEITMTSEGLRIELLESAKGTFFELGSPVPNQNCRELLAALAAEIAKVPNAVTVEGHTDSKAYDGQKYSNWELSTDRANAARKIMIEAALPESHLSQVRGYADRKLRYPDDPENPGNRRIAVLVESLEKGAATADAPAPPAAAPATPSAEHPPAEKPSAGAAPPG